MNRQVGFLGLIGSKTNGSPTRKKPAELVMISPFWGSSTSLAMENGVFGPPIDGHEMMANVRLQTIGFWGRGAHSHQKIGHAFIKARWPISPIMGGQCVCTCSQNENTNHIFPYIEGLPRTPTGGRRFWVCQVMKCDLS